MKSDAETVDEYLEELPAGRRGAIAALRSLVRKHLPRGYVERMNWGMICYEVPLATYPATYNGQPLGYVAIAAQKNHNALYLMGCHADSDQERKLREAYRKAGRKIDLGKSCLRFQTFEELPARVLGEMIAEISPTDFIRIYEKSRDPSGAQRRG